MNESLQLPVILDTYKKQELPLQEKQEDLNKYISKDQDAIKNLKKTKKRVGHKSAKLNQRKIHLFQNIQIVSNKSEAAYLTWKAEKFEQKNLCQSEMKLISEGENQRYKLQEALKDLKKLEAEYHLETILCKIKEYQNNTNEINHNVSELHEECKTVLNCAEKTSKYQIIPKVTEIFKSKGSTKNLFQIHQEVERVKKSTNTIDAQTKELAD